MPLKYIDVTRATSTSLDVMLDENFDDHWKINGDRELSDTWTGFTTSTMLRMKKTAGWMTPGPVRNTESTHPRVLLVSHLWSVEAREKQKRAIEKPKLDTASKLRGILIFQDDRNCDICFENQNYKGPLQKTHWYS